MLCKESAQTCGIKKGLMALRHFPRFCALSHLGSPHFRQVPLAVEKDEASNPITIRLLDADAEVLQTDLAADEGEGEEK